MNEEQMREDFEKWYGGEGAPSHAFEKQDGSYKYIAVYTAWNTWRAAIASVQQQIRNDALGEAAKIPRQYAIELADGPFGARYPEEATHICNASTNMADRIRALKGQS